MAFVLLLGTVLGREWDRLELGEGMGWWLSDAHHAVDGGLGPGADIFRHRDDVTVVQ